MENTDNSSSISQQEVEALVERASTGDSGAFGRLYDLYADRVYRYIFYRTSQEEDARDLTQDVFLKAWRGIPAYRRTATPFLGWLFTISHNRLVDYYRTRKDQVYLDPAKPFGEPGDSPQQQVEVEFTQNEIRKAISKLPGDQQQVIILSFIEGFEYPEIAASLHKSEGNIRVMMHRGLKKLRELLDRKEI